MALDGFDALLYRGTAGSVATTLMNNVRDVTPGGPQYTKNDVSTRGGGRIKQYALGQGDATLDIEMIVDNTDEDYDAMQTAYATQSAISLKCLDETSGDGLSGDWMIENKSAPQTLDGVQIATFTCCPAHSTTNPVTFVSVGS